MLRTRSIAQSMAFSVALISTITAVACKPDGSDLKADAAPKIFVMLDDKPAAASPTSYRILAFVPGGAADDSVVFCLASAVLCADATKTTTKVKGVLTPKGTQKFYTSESFVTMTTGMEITVSAKDAAGVLMTQSVRLKVKGAATVAATTTPTTPTVPPAAEAGASPCYKSPDEFTCKAEVKITDLTNEKRVAAGKPPLVYDNKMGFVSRLWSAEQNRVSKVSREWLDSGVWGQKYQQEFSVAGTATAENFGMSPTLATTIDGVAKDVFDMLWANAEFQATMLGDHKRVSAGLTRGTAGWYVSQDFAK